MLAGFGILLMLVYVMMIMLKVFWIELILLWRDIARPYKARNGEWQILSSLKKRYLMALWHLCLTLLWRWCKSSFPFD